MIKILNLLLLVSINIHSIKYVFLESNQVFRIGHALMSYIKAKHLEEKYGYKLIYQPFDRSIELELDNFEKAKNPNIGIGNPIKYISVDQVIKHADNINNQFFCIHACMMPIINNIDIKYDYAFRKKIKGLLTPKDMPSHIPVPENYSSLAVHVRTGGDYAPDKPFVRRKILPAKFPELSFYIDALNMLIKMRPDEQIYCYVFTDDSNPEGIVNTIKEKIHNNKNILFDYRKSTNNHNSNVVQDMYLMSLFKYLIRPESGLSIASKFIGNHEIVLSSYSEYENRKIMAMLLKMEGRRHSARLSRISKACEIKINTKASIDQDYRPICCEYLL